MLEWIPPGTELVPDVSAGDWILERLRPWEQSGGVRLHSFAPSGFETYARVFHPARSPDGSLITWADLGANRGVSLSPDLALRDVSGDDALDDQAPLRGTIPSATCEVLVRLLGPHTQTAQRCWFCLWEGNGAFWSSAHTPYPEGELSMADAKAQDAFLASIPKVEAEHRSYLLFRGPIEVTCAFEPAGWYMPPNLWWPEDRSWIVVTEVDGYSTYVGASRNTTEMIVDTSELEAIVVPHDVRMDP